jgi:hypothetical protein
MKALPPTNQKLWPRLKFLKKKSNSKAKGQQVKVMVSNDRSCQKEYTCKIWKPYRLPIKRFGKGHTPRSKVIGSRSWYQMKGWLIDYLLFYLPLKNISRIWRSHHCRWRAAKSRPMFSAQGLWAGRDLYRATPAVTRDLGFSGLIRRTAPFSRLLQHAWECGGSILTRILTGTNSEGIQTWNMKALPPTNQKVMTNVKVFEKKVKLQGHRSEGQGHGIKWNVFS